MPKSVLVQVVRLSISFEKEVHERVTDLADAHDVSTAWTIRKAANAYFGGSPPPRRAHQKRSTCWDISAVWGNDSMTDKQQGWNDALEIVLDNQQTMVDMVTPFCEMLKGKSQPEPPFNIAFPEAEKRGRNDALEIVLDTGVSLTGRDWSWIGTYTEIAEDMKERVKYEGARSPRQDLQQADHGGITHRDGLGRTQLATPHP